MKTAFLFLLILVLVGIKSSSKAMVHYDKALPLLHSVLDSPAKRDENATQDSWSARMNGLVASGSEREHYRYRLMATPASVWRASGIGFTIAGGALLLGGTALVLYADAETQRQLASGGRAYTSVYYLGAIALGVVGRIFLAIGLPIWLTHLHG